MDQPHRSKFGLITGAIVTGAILLFFAGGLTMFSQRNDEHEARQDESRRLRTETYEAAQRAAKEQESGIRTDGLPVSGLSAGERTHVCIDGETDDSTHNGHLDINQVALRREDTSIAGTITTFPRSGQHVLSARISFASTASPDRWVTYDSVKGRISSDPDDDDGLTKGLGLSNGSEPEELEFTLPASALDTLGDEVAWTVTLSSAGGPSDSCPNLDREILTSLVDLPTE